MKEVATLASVEHRPIDAFLGLLQAELRQDLAPARIEAVLMETEAHLRDRAEALIELGASRAVADAESIAAFGDAKRYAAAIIEAAGPSPARLLLPVRRLAALACGAAGIAVVFERTWHNYITFFLPAIFLLGVAAASYRARRWDLRGIVRVTLAASLATWIAMSLFWIRQPSTGPYELVWRSDIVSRLADARGTADVQESEVARMNTAIGLFQVPGVDLLAAADSLGLRRGDQILVPTSLVTGEYVWISEVRYEPAPIATAVHRWRTNGADMVAGVQSSIQKWRDWEGQLRQASTCGYVASLFQLWPWLAMFLPFGFIPLFTAHAMGVMAGVVVRALKRVRRRVGPA